MSDWGDLSLADRKPILDKICAAVKEAGAQDWVKIKSTDQFVGHLQNGQLMNQCGLSVEGSASADKKEEVKALYEKINAAAGGITVGNEITCAIGQGDSMGTIANHTKIGDEAETMSNIDHVPGQVLLLDFWATWCPPCQAPMAHNQAMLDKRGADWGDKVRIIGLSIDQDFKKLQEHVKAKGWTSVEHYWSRNGKNQASGDFGCQGVPHCLLVDTAGKICWVGHPSSRKLEEDIDSLLAGGVLTGQGTSKAAGGGDEGEGENKDVSDEDYTRLSAAFKQGCQAIVDDADLVAEAKKFQKAFFVMQADLTIDVNTGKAKGGMECITQLFGNAEGVSKITDKTEPISSMEGFTARDMIR